MMMQATLSVLAALFLLTSTVEGRIGEVDGGASRKLQKLPFLEIVGGGDEFTVFPLGVCQGDCDSDEDVSD
jgi:hypothetical protein